MCKRPVHQKLCRTMGNQALKSNFSAPRRWEKSGAFAFPHVSMYAALLEIICHVAPGPVLGLAYSAYGKLRHTFRALWLTGGGGVAGPGLYLPPSPAGLLSTSFW